MELVRKRKLDDRDFGVFHSRQGCTTGDIVSAMWSYNAPNALLFPVFGPQRVLDESHLKEARLVLAENVRELCLYDLKHLDHGRSVAFRDDCDDELQQIADRFYLKDWAGVCEFLREHRFLMGVLRQVRKKFDQYFGRDSRSALEIFVDPDDNRGIPKLFALISTSLSSNDASIRLDRLDEEWWLHQPPEVRRVLNIDVDYIDGV